MLPIGFWRINWGAGAWFALCVLSSQGAPAWAQDSSLATEPVVPAPRDAVALAAVARIQAFHLGHPFVRAAVAHRVTDRFGRSTESDGELLVARGVVVVRARGGELHGIQLGGGELRIWVGGSQPAVYVRDAAEGPLADLSQLLSGLTLADAYALRSVEHTEARDVVEVRPASGSPYFERLWLAIAQDGRIERVLFVDPVGVVHRLVLSSITTPRSLSEAAMMLAVPPETPEVHL